MDEDGRVFEQLSDEVGFPITDPETGEQRWLLFRLARDLFEGVAGPTYLQVDRRSWIDAEGIPRVISILQDMHRGAEQARWSGR